MTKEMEIKNRKAYHDYFVMDELECGIELKGHEVKSIRAGMCNINDAWCEIRNNELFLTNSHITRYDTMMDFDVAERRERRLLAHRTEINKFAKKLIDKGVTLIPLKMYFKNGKCKVLVGLCKGKHNYDKRNDLREKDIKRNIDRHMKGAY